MPERYGYSVVAESAKQQSTAAGLTGTDLAATIEAAQLKAALRAKGRQEKPTTHVNSPRVAEPHALVAELAFQRQLTHTFAKSPIVTAVLEQSISSSVAKDSA
ncbi:DUF6545 domain-containing protein [Streptomyces sp. NPDC020800]|uniref:DUF6545 domain-containing protein n=1 Tax=Streptomyces sp. NPDC020800 TaxID=3365092 RepID=UPI0037B69247